MNEELSRGAAMLGLSLAQTQLDKLERFVDEFQKYNRVHNLSAVRGRADILRRHILDSLSVVAFLRGPRIADLGSGGGLPAIPVAIARPEWQVSAVEANRKKCVFLRASGRRLSLANFSVLESRIEALVPADRYQTIVARALMPPAALLSISSELIAAGGRVVAMLGKPVRFDDVSPGYRFGGIERIKVPFLEAERHVAWWSRES